MDQQRLAFLLERYIQNSITAEELDELSGYLHDVSAEAEVLDAIKNIGLTAHIRESHVEDKNRLYTQILKAGEIQPNQLPQVRTLKYRLMKYAAAAAVVIGIGIYFYKAVNFPLSGESQNPIVKTQDEKIDMGSNKALLILADGSRVLLNKDSSGNIAQQGQYSINQEDGTLKYRDASNGQNAADNTYNTITTPKGSTYQLVLADGSKVWLNTNSSLTYPVAFNGTKREVKITGEAYFEVAKDAAKPFIVATSLGNVQVLGTHFNISAYPQAKMATTLLEGSVKVSASTRNVIIKPDQEAAVFSGGEIAVHNVDASDAIAWRDGYFLFDNQNIKEVMGTIAQWYDFEIEYQGDLAGKTFGGTIARFKNIDKLLKSIELTGAVHFKIEGRRVIVME